MVEIKDPKTFTYKVGEDVYDIPENTVDVFLKDNPNAKLFEEEAAKENGVIGTDASVTPEINTASISDPGSSVSTDPDPKTLYKDYSSAIAITEEEEISLNEPIDFSMQTPSVDIENNLDDASATQKEFLSMGFTNDMLNKPYVPYIKELEEAKEMLMDPAKFGIDAKAVANPTEEKIKFVAEKNIKSAIRQELIKSKAKKFLDDLPTEQRESLIPYKVDELIKKDNKLKGLNEEYQVIADEYAKSPNLFNLKSIASKFNNPDYNFDLEGLGDYKLVSELEKRINDIGNPENLATQASADLYNTLVKTYKEEVSKLQTIKLGNGKIVPKATYDLYQTLVQENEDVTGSLDSIYGEIEKIPTKLKDGANELKFLKQEYSLSKKMLEQVGANIGIAGLDAIGGSARVLSDLRKIIQQGLGQEGKEDILDEFAAYTGKISDERRAQIDKKYAMAPITFENAFDGYENMSTFIAQETVGQAGILTMLALGKIPGFTGIGLGSYEQQRRVLEKEEEFYGTEKSVLHKAGVSFGFAAAEVGLGAAPTLKIFNRGFKAASEYGKRTLTNAGTLRFIGDRLKVAILKDSPLESATEGLTVAVQNGIDILRGAKDSSQILEGVDHAAFTGGVLGFQFSTMPTLAGLALKPFSDYNTTKSVREKLKERNELYNIGYGGKDSSGEITDFGIDKRTSSFKIINEKIQEIDGQIYDLIGNLETKVSANLTPIGFDLFKTATLQQEKLRTKAEKIINEFKDGVIDATQRDTLLQDLKTDFDAYQVARNQFIKKKKQDI